MFTYPQKLIAATARHRDGATQADAGATIGADERTIRRWEHEGDEEWDAATEAVFTAMRKEGRGVAWRSLVGQARLGDVQACKEVLNRAEGAVTQKQELDATVRMEWWEGVKTVQDGEDQQSPA